MPASSYDASLFSEILDEISDDEDSDSVESYRPALQRLTLDAEALINGSDDVPGLQGGFESRAEVIHWEQRLCVRTLGEVPMSILQGIASQMVGPRRRPIMQVLISDSEMPAATQREWRRRIRQKMIHRPFERAFRRLRKDATEYAGGTDEDTEHDPLQQSHIAMRPSLDEIDEWQRLALRRLFSDGDGFDERDDILGWMPAVTNATHGEPITLPNDHEMAVSEFVDRWHDRDPMAAMLTTPEQQPNRETFAARFLIPAFQAGVRELLAGTKEVADNPTGDSNGPAEVS